MLETNAVQHGMRQTVGKQTKLFRRTIRPRSAKENDVHARRYDFRQLIIFRYHDVCFDFDYNRRDNQRRVQCTCRVFTVSLRPS